MANIIEWDDSQRAEWKAWLEERPQVIREMAAKLPPYKLYRMRSHRVTIHSYSEDGTITVNVTGEYNRVLFGRHVFGVKPEDLTECDLPVDGEDIGDTSQDAGYSNEDIEAIILPMIRKQMGFEKDPDV